MLGPDNRSLRKLRAARPTARGPMLAQESHVSKIAGRETLRNEHAVLLDVVVNHAPLTLPRHFTNDGQAGQVLAQERSDLTWSPTSNPSASKIARVSAARADGGFRKKGSCNWQAGDRDGIRGGWVSARERRPHPQDGSNQNHPPATRDRLKSSNSADPSPSTMKAISPPGNGLGSVAVMIDS